jgi:predicted nucleic acid-binding protein
MRIMVDLNVLLDVAQNRAPFYQDSEEVLARAREGEYEAFLPGHAVTTLFYLIAKFTDVPTAEAAVDGLLADFGVVGPDKAILTRARSLTMHDFEDCVVAASAEASGCQYVVSRNVTDFTGSPVAALTPADFLGLLPASDPAGEKE